MDWKTATRMLSRGAWLFMAMIVYLITRFIPWYSVIAWDARWFHTIFLTGFRISLTTQKSQFYCGSTGKQAGRKKENLLQKESGKYLIIDGTSVAIVSGTV
jgi:hypothetical protein